MRHCCVEDPTDLCSVNISDQGFSEVKVEDFQLFDNVAYINASENFLSLGMDTLNLDVFNLLIFGNIILVAGLYVPWRWLSMCMFPRAEKLF